MYKIGTKFKYVELNVGFCYDEFVDATDFTTPARRE